MTDIDEIIFSPNSAIDAAFKDMLPDLDADSQQRMRKAILDAKRAAEKYRDEKADALKRLAGLIERIIDPVENVVALEREAVSDG